MKKIIEIKSDFEATCSYGDTLSCLYQKQNPSEFRSLDFGPESQRSGRTEKDNNNLEDYLKRKRQVFLPKWREFPF